MNAYNLMPIGNPVIVDANTASTRVAVPSAPYLMLSSQTATFGAFLKFGGVDVAAAVGTVNTVATTTLTSTDVFGDGEQAIIGGVTYTFKTALTASGVTAYEVLIGANQTASHLNFLRAINKGAGGATLYGSGTLIHPTVTAASSDGTHTVINAKVAGAAGNSIGTTEGAAAAAMANASWTSTVMASGADGVATSFFLQPGTQIIVKNPFYDNSTSYPSGGGYIAGIKNGTAAVIVVQGMA